MSLLQRIVFDAHKVCSDVSCCRVRASFLRKSEFVGAYSPHQSGEAIVSFVAARLVIDSVLLLALPGELLLDSPGPRPHGRILDRDRIFERIWPRARPAFD